MSCVCCSTLNVTVGLYVTVILNYYSGVAIWKSLTSFCLALTGERAPIRDIWSYLFCLHGTVWNLFGFWWGGIQRGIQSPCGYHEISGLPKKKPLCQPLPVSDVVFLMAPRLTPSLPMSVSLGLNSSSGNHQLCAQEIEDTSSNGCASIGSHESNFWVVSVLQLSMISVRTPP